MAFQGATRHCEEARTPVRLLIWAVTTELRRLGPRVPTPLQPWGRQNAPRPGTRLQTTLSPAGGHKEPECLCGGHLCNGKRCLCCALTHGSLRRVWEPSAGVCLFSQELPPSLATETGLLGLHKTDRILEVKPPGTSGETKAQGVMQLVHVCHRARGDQTL